MWCLLEIQSCQQAARQHYNIIRQSRILTQDKLTSCSTWQHRAAVRENDGVDYIISFSGRISRQLLSLVPPYANVRVHFAEAATWSSDLCTFHGVLAVLGQDVTTQYRLSIPNDSCRLLWLQRLLVS